MTVGVPCWAAMWVSPVSTPITARHAVSTSTASTERREHAARGYQCARMSAGAPGAGDLADVEAGGDELGRDVGPPLGRPGFVCSVGLVHEQHGVAQVGAGVGFEGDRSGEVGGDAEVGTDALENVVDIEGPNSCSNAAEPHQKSRCMGWSRRSTKRSRSSGWSEASSTQPPSRRCGVPASLCAGARATSHVSLVARLPAAIRAWIAGRETTRSPMPNEIGATKTRPILRRRSRCGPDPGRAKPSRRSAHLLHRPQWRRRRGRCRRKCAQEQVAAKLEDLCLRQACERRPHFERVIQAELDE